MVTSVRILHPPQVILFTSFSNHLPTAVELDSDNFQQVMNPKLFDPPLVVIAVVSENNKADTTTILRRLSNKWSEDKGKDTSRSVVFAHMDANKWGKWLKGMYGIKGAEDAKVPPIVIADHTVSILVHVINILH